MGVKGLTSFVADAALDENNFEDESKHKLTPSVVIVDASTSQLTSSRS